MGVGGEGKRFNGTKEAVRHRFSMRGVQRTAAGVGNWPEGAVRMQTPHLKLSMPC